MNSRETVLLRLDHIHATGQSFYIHLRLACLDDLLQNHLAAE